MVCRGERVKIEINSFKYLNVDKVVEFNVDLKMDGYLTKLLEHQYDL